MRQRCLLLVYDTAGTQVDRLAPVIAASTCYPPVSPDFINRDFFAIHGPGVVSRREFSSHVKYYGELIIYG